MKTDLPHQPIIVDSNGTQRFKANACVKFLADLCDSKGIAVMNLLAVLPLDDADRVQFAQLIGYSVCGFSELSYVSAEVFEAATGEDL